ncbi:structural maintenance of chromosomes protein 6-like [Acyrthosiphon pisum]|uniref:Rad50/SbcC-type AAA domain-containing protein n=1 Tax=Acyrthosiphon pisum TaxID=7029 RepID=A0A8R2NK50_ACYPI|nr:structural maintenance of chromosomes protein 6-like [Acyrthosiphon pisum]|eukprot:XP_016656102.1 PREDICTED: structural maintenance of chromosomes protein 6-like [Acyrthosiphon pisum]
MNSISKSCQKFTQINSQSSNEDWYNGSIKSITLENFMCHANFHLSLNPRINFISGLNGSGKSAIQTALVVGFGGRASTTNRASSLKSLIKYGQPSATITIIIANSGEGNSDCGPYKPEVYGKQITIVRQITELSTTYKFLNENNKVVKGFKNELKNLTLHFNILVDNPICIMNQAMVKTFHKSANPNEKYDLFFRAISANIFTEKIEETKSVATMYSEKLENVKSVLIQCFKEVSEYVTNEQKSKQLETLKNSKFQYENEYAWYLVYQLETTYKECFNQIESLKGNLSENTDKTNILEQNIKANSETLIVKKNELANIENSRSRNHMVFMQTKKELQDKISEFDSVKQSVRKYDSALKLLISDRKDLEKHIEVERQKGNTNTLAQYKEILARYEQNCSEVEAAWKTNMEHEQTLHNTVDELKQKVGNLKNNELTPLQRKIGELNRNIIIMSQKEDRINFYGSWMPQLVKTIELAFNQNKFIKKPVGPIGEYIKVNNDKWIFSVENFLGRGTLRTFLVDNFTDNKVLQSIMDSLITGNARKPTVITSKFFDKVHNITAKETKNNLFRMLNFTSPVVANCLIDNNRIETIMLVDDTAEAMPMMENESIVPRNCNFCLTLDGTQIYPSPSYRVYSLQSASEPILLQSNVLVATNNLKREKKELEVKINKLNTEFKNFEQSKVENQQHLSKAQSETKLLKAKYDEYSKKINELKAKCEEEQDDRMATLIEAINDVDLKIAKAKEIKDNSMKPIPKFKEEISLIDEKLQKAKYFIEKTDRSAFLEEIETLQTQINKHKTEILQINNNSTKQKQLLSNLNEKVENEKKNLEKEIKQAEQLGKKIQVTRNEEDIRRDIEETNHKYNLLKMELEKTGGNHLLLRDEYMKKKEEYILHSTLHKQIEDIYKSNKKAIDLSAIALKRYIEYFRLKVIEAFDVALNLRKIKGKLEIDEHEQSMVISMFDNISTSCASGGERTIATVALILALWSNIQLPFYSIDEYDVYMDNVNRIATTKQLLSAIENRKNQFIILTPQDISHIKSADNIKIVKLKEPRT